VSCNHKLCSTGERLISCDLNLWVLGTRKTVAGLDFVNISAVYIFYKLQQTQEIKKKPRVKAEHSEKRWKLCNCQLLNAIAPGTII